MRKRKILGYGVTGFIALGVIGVAMSDTEEPTKTETVKEEAKAEEVIPKKKEAKKVSDPKADQEKVKTFYNALMVVDKSFPDKWKKVSDELSKNNIYGAYSAMTEAQKDAKRIWQAYGDIEVPKGLNKEVEKNLEEGRKMLELAYFVKLEGIKSGLKFLDNQKPSDMQDVKEKMQTSQAYMLNASTSLLKAKEQVGLPIE